MAHPLDWRSIGPLLLITTCTVALLPAALPAGWLLAQHRAGESIGTATERVVADSRALGDALDRWLVGRLGELRAWSEIPTLVEGVRRAAVEHHERGYTEETPEAVNALLVHDGNLGLAPQADEYLTAQIARSETWSRVTAGAWLRRRVAGRLGELADATQRLCGGDVRSEIRAEGNDEIARVARGVEKMRGTMRRALQIITRDRIRPRSSHCSRDPA